MSRGSSFGSVGFFLVCAYLQTWASHIMLPFPNTTLVHRMTQQSHRLDHSKPGPPRVYADPDSTKASAGSVTRRLRKVIQTSHSKAGPNRVYADPDSTKVLAGSVTRRLRKVPQGEFLATSDYQDPSCLQIQIYPAIQQNSVTSVELVKAIPAYSLHHPGPPSPPPSSWE